MHEEKNAEEERRPEHVKQHRTCSGLSELTQCRKIAVCLRCARSIGLIGVFEASGEHCRMEFFLEPLANPAQCSAAQCIKHSANHNGERNDERQHQERIAAAARQDAIIDLKQIDRRSEKKEIITAAICENEAERPRASPQGGFQRRLRRRHHLQPERRHQHCGPPPEICSAIFPDSSSVASRRMENRRP